MTATATPIPMTKPAPAAADELRRLALDELTPSPWNPRKHFADDTMEEMAESLRQKGQLTPILVRPAPTRVGRDAVARYEIGAGHRRFMAAPMAGLTHLLAVVRDLDDVAFLELLTIENRQREDLQPLDEAAGFRLLMEKAGYDVAKLAARIGLSVKYVYDRLKLLQLIPAAKQLLESGTITAGHAILIARLSKDDQARVVDQDEGGLFEGESVHPELELKNDAIKPRSVRELETWINDHVRLQPAAVDPFLFPDTAQQLRAASRTQLKVVHITHDWTAHQDVRHDGTKDRVYGAQSWKRADGQKKSKRCTWSALGVVVSGLGQGEAFPVCVNRDRCTVHWPKRAKQVKANAKAKAAGRDSYAEEQARQEAERVRQRAEQARWKTATPALLQALREKVDALPTTPGGVLWRTVVGRCGPHRTVSGVAPGRTPESLLRYLVFQVVGAELQHGYSWEPWKDHPAELKPFGIDAAAIVEKVAPKPKPAPATPKKAKKGSR